MLINKRHLEEEEEELSEKNNETNKKLIVTLNDMTGKSVLWKIMEEMEIQKIWSN